MAESAISSGTSGSSSDGAQNTAAIAGGLALISIAAASSILLQVGKNSPPPVQKVEYSGPSLSYYINEFKTQEITQAPSVSTETELSSSVPTESDVPTQTELSSSVQPESIAPAETELSSSIQTESVATDASISVPPESSPAEVSQVQVESQIQPETSSVDTVS